MKDDLRIVVLGKVQSQLRPIISTQVGNKKAIAADPPQCREYKKKVRKTARNYYRGEPLDEPLSVELDVYMEIPKSWTKKKKKMAMSGELVPTTRNDLDNLAKGVLDGMSGIVWKDDGCIVDLRVSKRYAKVARAEVRVSRLSSLVNSNSMR